MQRIKFHDVERMQKRYNLPKDGIIAETVSIPADSWNSGNDARIEILSGSIVKCVTAQDCYAEGIGGVEADKKIGIWVS